MHVSARSYLTAGVAFVGAGAIALTPIQPITPAMEHIAAPTPVMVSPTQVELAALVNPIVLWAEALGETVDNVRSLATTVFEDPAPILEAFLRNQFAAGSTLVDVLVPFARDLITGFTKVPQATIAAVRNILSGEIFTGVGELATVLITPIAGAMFPLLFGGGLDKITAILQNPFENISRVIGRVVSGQTLIQIGLPLLTDLIAPVIQVGATAQAIFDGLRARDLEAVINAVISFPSDMFNTIFNGSSNPMIGNGGLLGPFGLLAGLLGLRKGIAEVIEPAPATPQHPPAPLALASTSSFADVSTPPVDDVPGDAAGAVTVDVGLGAKLQSAGVVATSLEVDKVAEATDEVIVDEVIVEEVTAPLEEKAEEDDTVAAEDEDEDEARAELTESEESDDTAADDKTGGTSTGSGGDGAGNPGNDDTTDNATADNDGGDNSGDDDGGGDA